MSITTTRNIEFNEADIIMVTPAQPRRAFAATPIFFEAVHANNKAAIEAIAKNKEFEVDSDVLTMDHTINWSDRPTVPLANPRPKKTPAKKSQQEALARARGLQTSTRKLRDAPQA